MNYQYPVYWSINKAKILVKVTIVACFVVNVVITITCFLVNKEGRYDIYTTYHLYIPTCLDILFLIVTVVTYTFIFIKYRHTRLLSARRTKLYRQSAFNKTYLHTNKKEKPTILNLFFGSRFYVAVLITVSFLMFSVAPGLVYSCYQLIGRPIPSMMELCLYVLFKIGDVSEAAIYTFLQRPVRNMLRAKIRKYESTWV